VLVPLSKIDVELNPRIEELIFLMHVSPDKALRDASTEAEKEIEAFFVTSGMRVDVFKRVQALSQKGSVKQKEDKRFLDKTLKSYQRNGLNLKQEIRDQIEAKQKRMAVLSTDYSTHLNEENRKLEFTEEELAGTPADFRSNLKKNDKNNKYLVTLSYPDYFPIMKLCTVSATR